MQTQDKFIRTGYAADESLSEPTGDTKPVVWSEAIKVCGDEDVFCEVVKAFMEDAPNIFRHLEQAIQTKEQTNIVLYVHRLKGSARNIGAIHLSETALRMEMRAKEKNLEFIEEDYAELKRLYERLKNFISNENWLDRLRNESAVTHHD